MFIVRSRSLLFLFLMVASTAPSRAVIIYDQANDANDPSSPGSTAPAGLPWQYVARFGVNNASAVYLGHGFMITAQHVNIVDSGILLEGQTYARDTTFQPVQVGTADLKVVKILSPPALAPLPIALSTDDDVGRTVYLVGWGVGKGAAIKTGPVTVGWQWGGDSTRTFRWASNTTDSTFTLTDGTITLVTDFDASSNEGTVTLGDSGSGLFVSLNSTWKLAGLPVTVTMNGESRFIPQHKSYSLRIREYAHLLRLDAWKLKYLGNANAPDDDDPDGDGMETLTEYGTGRRPDLADADGLPTVELTTGLTPQLSITYTRLMSATDVSVSIEQSGDLVDWAPATASTEVVSMNGAVWTLRSSVSPGSASPVFLRLRVTRLPEAP